MFPSPPTHLLSLPISPVLLAEQVLAPQLDHHRLSCPAARLVCTLGGAHWVAHMSRWWHTMRANFFVVSMLLEATPPGAGLRLTQKLETTEAGFDGRCSAFETLLVHDLAFY